MFLEQFFYALRLEIPMGCHFACLFCYMQTGNGVTVKGDFFFKESILSPFIRFVSVNR